MGLVLAVGSGSGARSPSQLIAGGQLLLYGPAIAVRIAEENERAPDELLDNSSTEQPPATVLARPTYADTDPKKAQQIVNTVAQVASEHISGAGSGAGPAYDFGGAVYKKASPCPTPPGEPRAHEERAYRTGGSTGVLGGADSGASEAYERLRR